MKTGFEQVCDKKSETWHRAARSVLVNVQKKLFWLKTCFRQVSDKKK